MAGNSAIVAACHRSYTGFEANDATDLIAPKAWTWSSTSRRRCRTAGRSTTPRGSRSSTTTSTNTYYSVLNYDLHAVLDAVTHVVVPAVTRGVSHTGHVMADEQCLMFTVADGRLTQARIYADTAKGRDTIAGMKVYPSAANG